MSRGRKSGPRWWVYLLAGLVMLLLVGFAFRQAVGRFVLRHTLSALGRALQGRVTCERVSGDVFSNPRLERVLVVANGDTVRAASLAVRYELLPLVRGRIVLSEVVVERLDVRLAAERRAAGPDTTRHQFPDLEVRRLEVCGGSVSLAGQSRLDSIELSMSLHSSRPEMRLSLLSSRCRLVREGVGIRRMTGGCRVTQDSVTVDSFVLRTGGSRLSGAARVGLRPTGIGLEVEELSLDLAEARLGPGRLRVAGTVTADSAGQAAQVDYAADGLRWHEVEFPRLSGSAGLRDSVLLLEASGADRVLGSADASIRFDLRSQGIGGSVKVRNLAVDRIGIRVPGSGFRLDADVELSGRLGSLAKPAAPDSVDMLLAGRMSELGIDTVVAAVAYDAGFAELRRLELSGPAGRMEFAGRARTGAAGRNRLLAECRMQRLDLGLVERFLGVKASGRVSGALHAWVLPDSWYFRGRLSGESLGVEGVTAERWLLEADLSAGREYSGRVAVGAEGLRAGEVELSGAQFIWTGPEFDLRLERPEDRLRMQGEVEMRPGMQRGFDCRVLAAEFASSTDTLAVTEPFTLRLVRDTLRLSEVRMNVADGTVGLAGWLAGSGRPRVELHGRNLNLRKLQKLLRLPAELWGTADLDLCGRETLALAFAAADLEMPAADLRLKRVQGAATLTEERVDLQCLRFVNQVDTSVVSGHAGYSLAGGLRVGDVDFSAELADPGDWVFSFLHGTLNVRGGLVYGRVRVSGSPAQFVLDGRARLVRATVHVPAVSTVIERVNAELSFRDDKVHLDKLSGESGRGTVTATGLADFGPEMRLDSVRYAIRANGASLSPLPDVHALGSGDVAITWGPGRPLELVGDVRVEEAVITVGFGAPAGPPSPGADSFVYDLRVRADRGIWLRNRDADIELAVDLQLRRTMAEQTYAGRLSSRQGNLYYLDHTLRVTRGEIVFGNISTLNPEIDIAAELPVRQARGRQSGDYPERIVLALTGTLEQPVFGFSSDPAVWDEAQVASYLSLSVPVDELGAIGQKEAVTRMLSSRLLGYFQTQVTKKVRDFVALDYLEVESGLGTGGGARVTVGKYIGRKLYVSYTQNFVSELQPAFSVEYYLNRRNELLAERSADGRYSVKYRFKLKY